MSRRRLAVIALDGASPELIRRWAEAGDLPHLAHLINKGVFGPLRSVIPPVTGSAWGSFVTGVLPGRHGVFEWLRRGTDTYKLNLVDSKALPFPTLFEWLSQHGIRVGAMSVPLSFPIRPVSGFVVSDLLTPPGAGYTYPKELQSALERETGRSYPLAPPPWPGRPRAIRWLEMLKESLKSRAQAALYLAQSQQWDFFMLHVMETDSVQHQMFHQIDKIPRRRYRLDLGERNPVLEIYRLCDELVGRLIAAFGDETDVMIISDHGFGPHLFNLHLNTWLMHQGFLRLKKNLSTSFKKILFEMGICPENLYPVEENLRLLGKARSQQAYDWLGRFALSTQNIDWSKTQAYSYGNIGQIYLNRVGREPQGIVSNDQSEMILAQIEAGLRAWINPVNQEPVVESIYRKSKAYTERALERAPDLVFLPRDGYSPMGLSEFLSNKMISHPVAHSGWHRMDGVFIGCGRPFVPDSRTKLNLIDLFPVICRMMKIPAPDHIDGKIPQGLLQDFLVNNLINQSNTEITAGLAHNTTKKNQREEPAQPSLTEAEEEEIRERLKGLGYL